MPPLRGARGLLLLLAVSPSGGKTLKGGWIQINAGDTTCNPLDYGAVGDGKHDDTAGVQAAINACITSSGTALLPAGNIFLSWGLTITNAKNFILEVDGVLRFNNDTKNWKRTDAYCIAMSGSSFVGITGSGIVDGGGGAWYPDQNGFRPGLFHTNGGTDLLIRDVTFIQSPNHFLQLYTKNFEVMNTTILAWPACPEAADNVTCAHNTDGIDVHAQPAWIHDCTFSVGDDHVAMHANDTLVERCTFGTGHGASIGSLGAGSWLKNITVRDTTFNGAVQAIRIKADPGSSGHVHDVLYDNIEVTDSDMTILLTLEYPQPDPTRRTTLSITNVTFSNIVATSSKASGQFVCEANAPCTGIVVKNVTHVGTAPTPWVCQSVHGTVSGVTPPLTCFSA